MVKKNSDTHRSSAAIACSVVAHRSGEGDGAQKLSNSLEIEMVRTADLAPYPNNPRIHTRRQRRALKAAIHRFGFIAPIIIDDGTGIICGQLRTEIAMELGYDEIPAVRVGHLLEADLRALVIADNRIAELAEWDPKRLKTEFEYLLSVEYDLDLTGFEPPEIDFILGADNPDYDPQSDDVPELDKAAPPVSIVGDLWRLGKDHRLICGNALDPASYDALMAGDRAQMVFTHPLPLKSIRRSKLRRFV